jgi:DNA-directed RNA polymerase sigma subunit (sigma70/sigma32)
MPGWSPEEMNEDDPVRVYLGEIKVPPLTHDQEAECARHIRAGDDQAELSKKDLVEANLALFVQIAQQHPSEHVHILDLIQMGNQALLAAVQAFANSDAEDFSALAARFIERAIEHAAVTAQRC